MSSSGMSFGVIEALGRRGYTDDQIATLYGESVEMVEMLREAGSQAPDPDELVRNDWPWEGTAEDVPPWHRDADYDALLAHGRLVRIGLKGDGVPVALALWQELLLREQVIAYNAVDGFHRVPWNVDLDDRRAIVRLVNPSKTAPMVWRVPPGWIVAEAADAVSVPGA